MLGPKSNLMQCKKVPHALAEVQSCKNVKQGGTTVFPTKKTVQWHRGPLRTYLAPICSPIFNNTSILQYKISYYRCWCQFVKEIMCWTSIFPVPSIQIPWILSAVSQLIPSVHSVWSFCCFLWSYWSFRYPQIMISITIVLSYHKALCGSIVQTTYVALFVQSLLDNFWAAWLSQIIRLLYYFWVDGRHQPHTARLSVSCQLSCSKV